MLDWPTFRPSLWIRCGKLTDSSCHETKFTPPLHLTGEGPCLRPFLPSLTSVSPSADHSDSDGSSYSSAHVSWESSCRYCIWKIFAVSMIPGQKQGQNWRSETLKGLAFHLDNSLTSHGQLRSWVWRGSLEPAKLLDKILFRLERPQTWAVQGWASESALSPTYTPSLWDHQTQSLLSQRGQKHGWLGVCNVSKLRWIIDVLEY